jgi:lysophospholipase L1-like esterase
MLLICKKITKTRLLRYFLLLLIMPTSGAFAAAKDTAIMKGLIRDYFDGVATRNFRKLNSVTTGDFVIYEDGKTWNNDSVFRNIQYHQPFSVIFTLNGFRCFADIRSGNASYYSHADFVIADTLKFSLDFIETATFRKTTTGWKINMIHITGLKSPEVDIPSLYRKYDTVRYIPEHYQERMGIFSNELPEKNRIVLLGNSITEFGDWKRLLPEVAVINRGIAGDNTFGMLDRLQDVIALKPAKLLIEAGINDIGQGVPLRMISGNITSMAGWIQVKSPTTRVYVMSILPTNDNARIDYPEVAGKNAIVRELNRLLQQDANTLGYTYVDLASRLTDPSGNLDEKYARPDGLHLNEQGYATLVRLLKVKNNGLSLAETVHD